MLHMKSKRCMGHWDYTLKSQIAAPKLHHQKDIPTVYKEKTQSERTKHKYSYFWVSLWQSSKTENHLIAIHSKARNIDTVASILRMLSFPDESLGKFNIPSKTRDDSY